MKGLINRIITNPITQDPTHDPKMHLGLLSTIQFSPKPSPNNI